jgi:hypothetical protein
LKSVTAHTRDRCEQLKQESMKDKSPLIFSILSFAFIILLVWFMSIGVTGVEINNLAGQN